MTDPWQGIEMPADLPEGWQSRSDAVELLAVAMGKTLALGNDRDFLSFAIVAFDLERAGNDDWAHLIVQALLLHMTPHDLRDDTSLSEWLFDSSKYDHLLGQVIEDRASLPLLHAATLTIAGRVASAQGRYDQAAATFEAAAESWRRQGERREEAIALMALGAAHSHRGRPDDAERAVESSMAIFAHLGDRYGQALLMLNNVENALAREDVEGARNRLNDVRPLIRTLRDGHLTNSFILSEASIQIDTNEFASARRLYAVAVSSARRRQDLDQLVAATRNLAKVTTEHFSRQRGITLWAQARDVARQVHDWREEQAIERALGVELARERRFAEAVEAFENAEALNERFGDRLEAARVRADLGAATLSWAVSLSAEADDAMFNDLLARAEQVIDRARHELEELDDFDWAEITVRNLRAVWSNSDHSPYGVNVLIKTAETFANARPEYSAEALRNAALLSLSQRDGQTESSDDPIGWLVAAVKLRRMDDDDRAWSLANDASLLTRAYGLHVFAVQLFDAALQLLDPTQNPTAWGTIQNDAALAAAAADLLSDAEARLRGVTEIARISENRVLLQLAVSNLGELAARRGSSEEARALFIDAAGISEALGDYSEAADSWASITNSWVLDGNLEEARRAAAKTALLASQSTSSEAVARAESSAAGLRYLEGDFETAHALWMRCASLVDGPKSGEYLAFALDSLARLGDWRRFKRQLDKLARSAQENGTQLDLVSKLDRSVGMWLNQDRPKAAGIVLANLVALSLEGLSISVAAAGREVGGQAAKDQELMRSSHLFGAARAYLKLWEFQGSQRLTMRREYEKAIRRIAGYDADQVIELVDDYALSSDDDLENLSG